MIVMMIAITPSLKASNRPVLISPPDCEAAARRTPSIRLKQANMSGGCAFSGSLTPQPNFGLASFGTAAAHRQVPGNKTVRRVALSVLESALASNGSGGQILKYASRRDRKPAGGDVFPVAEKTVSVPKGHREP